MEIKSNKTVDKTANKARYMTGMATNRLNEKLITKHCLEEWLQLNDRRKNIISPPILTPYLLFAKHNFLAIHYIFYMEKVLMGQR